MTFLSDSLAVSAAFQLGGRRDGENGVRTEAKGSHAVWKMDRYSLDALDLLAPRSFLSVISSVY